MKLIVGLGNPGEKYKNNRHNVGFQFVDYIAKLLHCYIVKNKQSNNVTIQQCNNVLLAKPLTFMNNSGPAVTKLIKNFKFQISNLIVVHDDLDIPLGKFKIQKATGPQLHNGIESVEKALRTKNFWRVRIGVDNRPFLNDPERAKRVEGETYVLQDFTQEEKQQINQFFPTIYQRLKNDKLIP